MHPADLIRAHMPPGGERDALAALVGLGLAFRAQHRGRRPGVLRRHVAAVVARMPAPRTFDALLTELEFDALRGRLQGSTPILRVDRREEVVRYIEHGVELECGFRRLRNIAGLRNARGPLSRESVR